MLKLLSRMECKKGTQGTKFPRIPKGRYKSESQNVVPRETIELINMKKGLCKECQIPCTGNSYHFSEHGIQIPTNEEILQLMEEGSNNLRNAKGLVKKKGHLKK